MLDIRPNCEHCNKDLPYDSTKAYICTFECTYCEDCVTKILKEICPNCGGNFVLRPIRPKRLLAKYPPSTKRVYNPTDLERHYKSIKNNDLQTG
jgi:hypothetical protein